MEGRCPLGSRGYLNGKWDSDPSLKWLIDENANDRKMWFRWLKEKLQKTKSNGLIQIDNKRKSTKIESIAQIWPTGKIWEAENARKRLKHTSYLRTGLQWHPILGKIIEIFWVCLTVSNLPNSDLMAPQLVPMYRKMGKRVI